MRQDRRPIYDSVGEGTGLPNQSSCTPGSVQAILGNITNTVAGDSQFRPSNKSDLGELSIANPATCAKHACDCCGRCHDPIKPSHGHRSPTTEVSGSAPVPQLAHDAKLGNRYGSPGTPPPTRALSPRPAVSENTPIPPLTIVRNNSSSDISTQSSASEIDTLKVLNVSIDDPSHKVIPIAMKMHHLKGDWQQYSLYVVYGDQERCLELNEKPLIIFKQLDDEGRKPYFMLRKYKTPAEGPVNAVGASPENVNGPTTLPIRSLRERRNRATLTVTPSTPQNSDRIYIAKPDQPSNLTESVVPLTNEDSATELTAEQSEQQTQFRELKEIYDLLIQAGTLNGTDLMEREGAGDSSYASKRAVGATDPEVKLPLYEETAPQLKQTEPLNHLDKVEATGSTTGSDTAVESDGLSDFRDSESDDVSSDFTESTETSLLDAADAAGFEPFLVEVLLGLKSDVINRVMTTLHNILLLPGGYNYSSNGDDTSGNQQESNHSISEQPISNQTPAATSRKWNDQKDEEEPDDGNDRRPNKRKRPHSGSVSPLGMEPKFACPFFKHNPLQTSHGSCRGPGWQNTHRLKYVLSILKICLLINILIGSIYIGSTSLNRLAADAAKNSRMKRTSKNIRWLILHVK